MPHYAPGINVYEDGVFVTRSQDVDARANIAATKSGKFAELDATGGGGGSSIEADLDGSPLTATAASFNATEGLFASAATNAITYSVYGAQAGVLASRPAAARSNKRGFYYATDTKTGYTSDGSTWTTLFTLGTLSSQNANAVVITGGTITGITPLAVADGGTGASTAAGARTNLKALMGLVRTSVKTGAYTAVAGDLVPVDTTAGNVPIALTAAPADGSLVCVKQIIQGGTNTVSVTCGGSDTINRTGGATSLTLTLNGESALLLYDASSATWTLLARDLSLTLLDGRYQPLDAELTALAGLVSAADKMPYFTGVGTAALTTVTSFFRGLMSAATAVALRLSLGLGDMALQNRPALNIGRLNVLGHSWIAGATVGTTGTPYMEMQGMLARVAGMFGIHNDNIMNMAMSGSYLTAPANGTPTPYSGWNGALQYLVPSNASFLNDPSSPVITHGPATPGAGLLVHGINDNIRNIFSVSTQGRNAWKHALRTYLSISRAGAFYKHKYLNSVFTWDTQLTFSGFPTTTTQTTGNSGSAVRQSALNGHYVEFLIPADFRGGTIAFCFISGKGCFVTQNGSTAIGATTTNVNASMDYLSIANGDVLTLGFGTGNAEDVRVTAGGGTAALTTTATTKNHANGEIIVNSTATQVDWTTSGSNATITGSTSLGGQGYAGTRVSVVKRFACTAADAGKTIRATVSGMTASMVESPQFDSVWIEAELVPPVVILNTPRFAFGGNWSFNTATNVANQNADTATIKAEFDANVAIADIDSLIFNKGGTVKTTTVSSNTVVVTANTLASWDISLGDTVSFAGNSRVVTAITGPVGSDYTITFNGAALSLTATLPVSNAKWFHTDLVHWNGVGHGVVAGLIYDAFAGITGTTSAQLGNTSATWVQDQRDVRLGIINGQYLVPPQAWTSPVAQGQNQIAYTPVFIPEECWVTGFGVCTSTAVASSQAEVGIYDSDYTLGRPGGLIADLGTVNCATSNVFLAPDVCYVRLRPGRYWVAVKSVGANPSLRGVSKTSTTDAFFVASPAAVANPGITGYTEAYATAGLPGTATPVETTAVSPQALLQLRAAELA